MLKGLYKEQRGKAIFKIIFYLFILIFFIMPMIRLLLMSFKGQSGIGLSNYINVFSESRSIEAIKNTIIIGIFSNIISVILGAVFAFLVAYTNIKWKALIELLVLMPFIIPSYIITLSWSSLFTNTGVINTFLSSIGLGKIDIYTIPGIILVLGICNIPIVYMITINMLRKIPSELEWAAIASGYSKWQTLFKINLPQVMPAIMSGGILSFLAAIDNFAVPAFLGISSGIPVLSTYIYEKAIGFGPKAFNVAATLSIVLSLIAIIGTFLQGLLIKKNRSSDSIKEDYSVRIKFSKKVRMIIQGVILTFLLLINIVPIITMIMSSLQKAYGVKFSLSTISFKNYEFLLSNKRVMSSVVNSLVLASIATVICIVLGVIIAYIKVRKNSIAMKIGENVISLTYAIPGIVLALAMILHWTEPLPGFRPNIYGTIKILIIAYITRYLILQIKSGTTAISAVDLSLEEAARVSGASKIRLWCKIIIPLISKQVLASAFLMFVSAMTEVTLSSMLASVGTKTIGLTIFSFQQAGNYNVSAAMSTIIIVLVLIGYLLPRMIIGKRKVINN